MSRHWYVLQTLSSQEDQVKQLIENSKDKWTDGALIEQVKVPTLEMGELRRGKKKIIKKKFMPGYVFIELDLTDELLQKIRNIPGVMGFISSGNVPQILADEEIKNLFTEMGEIKEDKTISRLLFATGETVKILDGPFANFQGDIHGINSEKNKVTVMVEIFGRSTPVELDYLQVGKA